MKLGTFFISNRNRFITDWEYRLICNNYMEIIYWQIIIRAIIQLLFHDYTLTGLHGPGPTLLVPILKYITHQLTVPFISFTKMSSPCQQYQKKKYEQLFSFYFLSYNLLLGQQLICCVISSYSLPIYRYQLIYFRYTTLSLLSVYIFC